MDPYNCFHNQSGPPDTQAARSNCVQCQSPQKELVGDFKNGGRKWRPQVNPEQVRVDDFGQTRHEGKPIPLFLRIFSLYLIQQHHSPALEYWQLRPGHNPELHRSFDRNAG
ncbi:MAG: ISAzo13-like element transposase-related protein [Methylococcales bacterium]